MIPVDPSAFCLLEPSAEIYNIKAALSEMSLKQVAI
jgi:hypothetical protein